jgi:predicted Zn-dependent protease
VAGYLVGRQGWASYHYRQGLSAAEKRDFASARRHLDICLREWPRSAETRFQAARVARRSRDFDSAQRLLREARKLGWVPEAIDLEQALIMVQTGSFRSVAPALVDFARRDHPDTLLILEVLAPAALDALELDIALPALERWIELDPSNPFPHVRLGDVNLQAQQRGQAAAHYREAMRLNPEDPDVRLRLADMLLDQKQPAEALEHYLWLLQREPENRHYRRGHAYCLVNGGNLDDARPILEDLHQKDPTDGLVLMLLGQLELKAGRNDAAEKLLRKAAQIHPYEPVILYTLAQCLDSPDRKAEQDQVMLRRQQAEEDLARSRDLMLKVFKNPRDAELRQQLGACLLRNGLVVEAKRWLESALREDPRHAATYDTLATYYDRVGELDLAKEMRKRAEELKKASKTTEKEKR